MMRQKYDLNIRDDSRWLIATPLEAAKQLPFHVLEYGHFICDRNFYTERSGKNAMLLIYTISGRGFLRYMKREYVLKPNTAVLIHCEKYQYFRTMSDEPWEEKFIHFNGRAAREFYTILNPDAVSVIDVEDGAHFNRLMDETIPFLEPGDIPSSIHASLHLTEILTWLIDRKFERPGYRAQDAKRTQIEKAIDYMKQHYRGRITVDELAQQALLSKYYFIKLFDQVAGTSPYSYLTNVRINAAKHLLATTDLPVADVAGETGFGNSNSFIKAFRKVAGVTPMEYRKSI